MSANKLKNQAPPPESDDPARPIAIPKEQADATQPRVAASPPKTERIGDILRRARLEKNDDLYLIADYLRIKPHFLVALENSHYDELPADAYVIGFLRTYANFLGVNGKDAVDRYRYEMAGRRKKPVLSMPTPVSEARAPTGIVMAGATIMLLLIYALWYGFSSSNRAQVSADPQLPALTQTTTVAPATPPSANDAAPASTAPISAAPDAPSGAATNTMPTDNGILITKEAAPSLPSAPAPINDGVKTPTAPAPVSVNTPRVTLRATQSSWVMITDPDGKAIYDHILKPGESYQVPNAPGLSLTTGNSSGIILSVDGRDLPPFAGGVAHVVRNLDLNPDHLSALSH